MEAQDDYFVNLFTPLYKILSNFWLKINNANNLKILNYISQPATFWRSSLVNKIGLFNPDYRYGFDYDYWLRISQSYKIYFLDKYLARFRVYPTSISGSNPNEQFKEEYLISFAYSGWFYKVMHYVHAEISRKIYSIMLKRKNR